MCKFSRKHECHERIRLRRNLVEEMPCRIEEKEGEGVRLTFRLWCEERGKREERETSGSAKLIGLPEPKLPSIGPCIQRISRD